MVIGKKLLGLRLACAFLVGLMPAAGALAQIEAANTTLTAIVNSAHLVEPLVATGPTTGQEDTALNAALSDYKSRSVADDYRALKAYAEANPSSPWATSVWVNLGFSYLYQGYFSEAIAAWDKAWKLGRKAADPRAKAMVDRALGELLKQYTNFGQFDRLNQLLAEVDERAVSGAATEALQSAKDTLYLEKNDPRHLFNCGPIALRFLISAERPQDHLGDFLPFVRVSAKGTNLLELTQLAAKAQFDTRVILRTEGQAVPVPSIVHWKLGHYGAITAQANGRYRVEMPSIPGGAVWVTPSALDAESSGYFLLPKARPLKEGWKVASDSKIAAIYGKGPTSGTAPGAGGGLDEAVGDDSGGCPMCAPAIRLSSVGVTISDTPVGYAPALGPSTKVKITYNQREDSQPANFSYSNIGSKWTLGWISFITDDPTNIGANVSRYLGDGGAYYYTGYDTNFRRFAAQYNDGSTLTITSLSPISYRLQFPNGSAQIFSQADASAAYPRRVFLSQIVDPQGNALTLNYDGNRRITSVTDAVGRATLLSYDMADSGFPYLITKITDPFGRFARITYDGGGRLTSITDIIGITSSVTYDANSLVKSLTTPYGTTQFSFTAPGANAPPRFVDVTDPLGNHERVEWLEPAPIPDSEPVVTVPQGMVTVNQYLVYRNSFYWDKSAYALAGCTVSGGCDYTKAVVYHYTHLPNSSIKSTVLESKKRPLENRVWFNYPGQSSPIYSGSYAGATFVGRVLDDGSTQLVKATYDSDLLFKQTQRVDPVGRTTRYAYSTPADLAAVSQVEANGFPSAIAQFTYNVAHRPLVYTDAANQTTVYAYSGTGQLTSSVDPLGNKYSFQYDSNSNLSTVVNPNAANVVTFTYDSFARIASTTDSEGLTLTYAYDPANRITQINFPDGTTEVRTYKYLDLVATKDRLGRTTQYAYDANRRLTQAIDAAGKTTQLSYTPKGSLRSLIDPGNNTTIWSYDDAGRVIGKTYADGKGYTVAYESTTSRVKSLTDALAQTKQFSYGLDNNLTSVSYLNPAVSTPSVAFTYDPAFPRRVSMTDGTGTSTYSYSSVGTLGALNLKQEVGPLASTSYTYDALGRVAARKVSGASTETFAYDNLGRLSSHGGDLGSFTYSYLGQTPQLVGRSLAGSTLTTSWSYLDNLGDRRLAGIANTGLSAQQFTNFQYTSIPGLITSITQTSDAAISSSVASQQTASFNNLNQLTNLSGQAYSWDLNGNLLSDGSRNYTWDAENRLVGISYTSAPGKATTFTYDGLGRRVTTGNKPSAGGTNTVVSYHWCGDELCQARDASGTVARGYYAEGELVSGQPVYYGVDQIGSVRRAFVSASNAPAYDFDEYGKALQSTPPLTDFGFAGLVNQVESGLSLAQYRAYDPVVGRWISRDPIQEAGGINLYSYVGGDPVSKVDPMGLSFASAISDATGGCSSNSFADDVMNNFVDVQDEVSLEKTGISLALGGPFAKQYGGLTALGAVAEMWRDSRAGFIITGVGSRTFLQAAATGAATWVINGVLIKGSFDAGVLMGSIFRTAANRAASSAECACKK